MATGIWSGFWSETGRKVARHQKHRVQGWFTSHPATFLLAWGVKGLVWNTPRAAWRGGRKLTGRTRKTKTLKATNETVTVITNAGTGTARVSYGGEVVTVIPRNATRPATTFLKGPILLTGRDMLNSTPVGGLFLALAREIDIFAPERDKEATSTLNLMSDLHKGFARLAGGVDTFSDTVFACGMHARVVHHLYQAVEDAETLAERARQARRLVEVIYGDRLVQEDSTAGVLNALPVLGSGEDPVSLVPLATRLAGAYMAFEPRIDEEAVSVLELIKVSQAGWAILADALARLSARLGGFQVDRRVRAKITAAEDAAVATAAAFGAARRSMTSLYRAQMAQESTGTTTILTIPLGRS
ncbi:hypothetical protein [Glycomyces sp. MUSA5-2]|uniref:hypothetical protein n=1 Tax=Glycomyces sp. MUSA5-2 TaxID=2053002 RepID=UPI003009B3F6